MAEVGTRTRDLLARVWRAQALLEALVVLAFFTVVAVFATWPLAAHPLGGFYGFGNDNWGGIPYLGWLHDAYLGPGNPSFDPELQAPFGLEIPEHAVQPMDRVYSLVLGGFGQGLGAYNAQIFLSFVLAGCTMYLLARYVTGSPLAALVAGFAFTFSPFHLSIAMQYNALGSIQWIPLYLLALLVLLRRGRLRDAGLAGAAFALVTVTSYYYAWFLGWFTLVVVACFAVAAAIRRRRARDSLWPAARRFIVLAASRGAVGAAVAVALAGPLLISSAQGAADAGSAAIEHPINEAVRYSARPWMFLVPPHDNPVVGDELRPWIVQHAHDAPLYEQAVYLGYALLALGILAFLPWRRLGPLTERARFARGPLLAGAVVGMVIAIGPYIPLELDYWRRWQTPEDTAHVPSLSWVMFHLAPVFRFFARAFVLTSACLSVMAAIGLARLERRPWMTVPRRVALATAVLALIGLEFSNAPPHVWYSAGRPPWVKAAKKLPAGSKVVEYPVAAAFSPRSLYYMFWQTKHRRWTTNPPVTPEAASLAGTVRFADDPKAGAALRQAGVDYAIVHTKLPPETTPPYQPGLPNDSLPPDTGVLNPWFEVEERTSDAVVYRVRAAPRKVSGALVRAGDGFGALEPEGPFEARWLESDQGQFVLFVAGPKRPLTLTMTVSSFARPRFASLSLEGRDLDSFIVPAGRYVGRTVRLGRLSAGRYTIELSSAPGPQSIREATGSLDTRSVSLRIQEPIVVRSTR